MTVYPLWDRSLIVCNMADRVWLACEGGYAESLIGCLVLAHGPGCGLLGLVLGLHVALMLWSCLLGLSFRCICKDEESLWDRD